MSHCLHIGVPQPIFEIFLFRKFILIIINDTTQNVNLDGARSKWNALKIKMKP